MKYVVCYDKVFSNIRKEPDDWKSPDDHMEQGFDTFKEAKRELRAFLGGLYRGYKAAYSNAVHLREDDLSE